MRMSLVQKGAVGAAPAMPALLQPVVEAVASWSDVTAARHRDLYHPGRADGADFHFGDIGDPATELGHLHFDGAAHVATSLTLRRALLRTRLAEPMVWYDDWIVAAVRDAASASHAIWLYRLNYDRLAGVSERELTARIDAAAEACVV